MQWQTIQFNQTHIHTPNTNKNQMMRKQKLGQFNIDDDDDENSSHPLIQSTTI